MEDYEIQNVEIRTVSQRRGSCCIHQTVMTTPTVQTDQKLRELVARHALWQIDDSDYNLVAEQVAAIEAVVAQVKQIDAAMKNRVEKVEKELAELKRELERCRQEQDRWPWGKTLARTVAGAILSDGLRSKFRGVRNLLNLILDE